jgi:hypothetical protein
MVYVSFAGKEAGFLCVLSQPHLFFGWRGADCAAKSMERDRLGASGFASDRVLN